MSIHSLMYEQILISHRKPRYQKLDLGLND